VGSFDLGSPNFVEVANPISIADRTCIEDGRNELQLTAETSGLETNDHTNNYESRLDSHDLNDIL
jgi:hypothetical protein